MDITNDTETKRFVARLDGSEAVAEYQLKEPVMIFTHTEVPRAMRGGGVGSKLVLAALDEARMKGYEVVPLCPFVASVIRRHGEYRDLVPDRFRYLVRGDLPGRPQS